MTAPPNTLIWIAWAVGLFVLLRMTQYLLAARTYLTCAARSMSVAIAQPDAVGAEERAILESVDEAMSKAGYRFLFTGRLAPLLTYYEGATFLRIFISERGLVRAVVRRRPIPETNAILGVQLESTLVIGRTLVTTNVPSVDVVTLPGVDLEVVSNADVESLDRRHMERIAAVGGESVVATTDQESARSEIDRTAKMVRTKLRAKGYTNPTSDPDLDAFTLHGAFALAHASLKMIARQKKAVARTSAGTATESARQLRAAADTSAVLQIALHPLRAPDSDRALWLVMAGTAAASFAGMSILWSYATATVILTVIAIHEAGHAVAMRYAGYRDVHVFFVPLVGAMTIGRDTGASVRARLSVLFAGPVPGLWLAALLLWLQGVVGHYPLLKAFALGLLAINVLNLLPVTPFDGGRILEVLTRPNSVLRIVIHGASGVALFGIGAEIGSEFLMILGVLWLLGLGRQIAVYRLRRKVWASLEGRTDTESVVRAACAALAAPAFSKWRGPARIATVRLLVQQFAQVQATTGDRVKGVFAYLSAWVPVLIALLLWRR